MIRELRKTDIKRVAEIWLNANLQAHSFISPQYWMGNFDLVKAMLPQVYVYEDARNIQGFVGLNSEQFEGIFVSGEMRSQGIGRFLLDFIKTKKPELHLNVYRKNTRAIRFYQREDFEILNEGLDEAIGEKDCAMLWRSK